MNGSVSPLTMNPSTAAVRAASPAVPRRSRTLWFGLGGLLAVAALGGAAYYKNKTSDKGLTVTTEKAVTKTITQLVNATGKIQPEVEVKIAPEVSGEIVELPLREGAVVKKGDLLVRIKPDNYRYQVDQREADLAATRASSVQSRAQLLKLQEDLKRSADLFEKKLISDSEFTAAKAAYCTGVRS